MFVFSYHHTYFQYKTTIQRSNVISTMLKRPVLQGPTDFWNLFFADVLAQNLVSQSVSQLPHIALQSVKSHVTLMISVLSFLFFFYYYISIFFFFMILKIQSTMEFVTFACNGRKRMNVSSGVLTQQVMYGVVPHVDTLIFTGSTVISIKHLLYDTYSAVLLDRCDVFVCSGTSLPDFFA